MKNISSSCSNTISARVKKLLSLKKVSINSCPSPALLFCKWVLIFLLSFYVLMLSSKCSSIISLFSEFLCSLFSVLTVYCLVFFQFWPVPPQPWGCFPPLSSEALFPALRSSFPLSHCFFPFLGQVCFLLELHFAIHRAASPPYSTNHPVSVNSWLDVWPPGLSFLPMQFAFLYAKVPTTLCASKCSLTGLQLFLMYC